MDDTGPVEGGGDQGSLFGPIVAYFFSKNGVSFGRRFGVTFWDQIWYQKVAPSLLCGPKGNVSARICKRHLGPHF